MKATSDGRVALMLRHPRTNGATHAVFTELGFMRKLAALVPPPGRHQPYFAAHPDEGAVPIPSGDLVTMRSKEERAFNPAVTDRGLARTADGRLFADAKEALQHARELFFARQLEKILPRPTPQGEGEATHVVHSEEQLARYRAAIDEALKQVPGLEVGEAAAAYVLNQKGSPLLAHYDRARYDIHEDGSEFRPRAAG